MYQYLVFINIVFSVYRHKVLCLAMLNCITIKYYYSINKNRTKK